MRDLSMGQVCKLLQIGRRTGQRWFDSGRLQGYRTPGPRGRRYVSLEKLRAFMHNTGMDFEAVTDGPFTARVLLITTDNRLALMMKRELWQPNFKLVVARAAFGAGYRIATFRPDAVVIDFDIGPSTVVDIVRAIRGLPDLAGMPMLGLSPTTGFDVRRFGPAVDEVLERPIDAALLRDRLFRLVSTGKQLLGPLSE